MYFDQKILLYYVNLYCNKSAMFWNTEKDIDELRIPNTYPVIYFHKLFILVQHLNIVFLRHR